MMTVLGVFVGLVACLTLVDAKRPHIVLIVVDDLGWNDISAHGSKQIPTPNIDFLASDGFLLDNFYVNPVCSPTRSSLYTGRSIVSTGIYMPLEPAANNGLNETCNQGSSKRCFFLPEVLKTMNYHSVMHGKWHVGMYNWNQTPLERGFDAYETGYLSGAEDYFSHFTGGGFDFWMNATPAWNFVGNYSTYVFGDYAVETIKDHAASYPESTPLFMLETFQAVHAPLQAPPECIAPFNKTISNNDRRIFAGMDSCMDAAVGRIVDALKSTGMWDDTIVVVMGDNGGPAGGFNNNMASALPLLGRKHTGWEGGVRGVGLIRGPGIENGGMPRNYLNIPENRELLHVSDLYFSLIEAAAQGINGSEAGSAESKAALEQVQNQPEFADFDGMYNWDALRGVGSSNRSEVVWYAFDGRIVPGLKNVTGVLRSGDMKLVIGPLADDLNDDSGRTWIETPNEPPPSDVKYTVDCGGSQPSAACNPANQACLFNVTADPCEYRDLSSEYPDIVASMFKRLSEITSVASLDHSGPNPNSPTCEPSKANNGTWTPCDGKKP